MACLRWYPVRATDFESLLEHGFAVHSINPKQLDQDGVDINTIRARLGHVSLATTNIYAEVHLERKAARRKATDDVHAHGLPLGEDVRAGRQSERQRRPVDLLELQAPRPGELAERPHVETPGLPRACDDGALRTACK